MKNIYKGCPRTKSTYAVAGKSRNLLMRYRSGDPDVEVTKVGSLMRLSADGWSTYISVDKFIDKNPKSNVVIKT